MRRLSYCISLFAFLLIFPFLALAQKSGIRGQVKGENYQSLIGATIMVQGTQIGAYSGVDGSFSLELAPGNYTVLVTYLGYESDTSEVQVLSETYTEHNIMLKPQTGKLGEVVFIGYGSKVKKDITGSVATVSGKEIADIPIPSFEAGLQGKALGVEVVMGSGLAGSPSLIRIRGVASVSSSGDPLYIIDGVPVNQDYFSRGNRGAMNQNPLAAINPLDIEEITILKDAAATAIYGARGSNGVIIVTTKRAKIDGWNIDFNMRLGTSSPTYLPEMLNSEEFLQLYQEAWENDGNVGRAPLPSNTSWEEAQRTNTNWVDEIVRTGFKQTYGLSVGYKGKNWGAYVNYSRSDNESYIKDNKYLRNSVRLNLDYEPVKGLKINASSSYVEGTNFRVYSGWAGGLGAALSTALPIYQIKDSAGNWDLSHVNPVAVQNLLDWKTFETRSINSINMEYEVSPRLKIKAFYGLDYSRITDDIHEDGELIFADHEGNAIRDIQLNTTQTFNAVGTYKIIDQARQKLNIMVGVERILASDGFQSYFEDSLATAFYENEERFDQLESQLDIGGAWAINSAFARLDYSLFDRYLVDFTFRTDGSSKFGPNNRYSYFPAIGLGWIISDEAFFKGFEKINFMKLKTGFGLSGNVPGGANEWRQVWIGSSNNINYNSMPTVYPTNHENPNLKWETSRILDISLEMGFLKNKITTEFAVYNKVTEDILLSLSTPASTGFGSYWENTGKIRNSGVEFSITSKNISKANFSWETQFFISRNFNKVLDLGIYFQDALSGGTNDTRVVVGQPLGTNYLVRFSHVEKETGRPVYLDKDGNETYTWSNNDRVAVGSVLPKAFGTLNNNVRIGQFYITTSIVYKWGGTIYNSSGKRQNGVVTDWNMTTDYFNRWTEPGDEAKYPKLSQQTESYGIPPDPYQYNTTLFLQDGSYARLRFANLTYSVPKKFLKDKLRVVQVGLGVFNMITLTRFIGGDPEIARDFENAQDRNMSSSITYLSAPQEKSIVFNLNITF